MQPPETTPCCPRIKMGLTSGPGASLDQRTARCSWPRLRVVIMLAAVVVMCVVGGTLASTGRRNLLEVADWMEARAPVSALYYAGFLIVWIMLCMPSTILELIGAFIFHPITAFVTLIVAKQIACCLAFLLGRCLGADALQRVVTPTKQPDDVTRRWRAFVMSIERHPWRVAMLIRLLYLPLGLKNYGMACLPCPFYIYAVCTFVAGIPYTVLWVHVGASSRSLLDVVNGGEGGSGGGWVKVVVLAGGLVVTVALLVVIAYHTGKYARKLEQEELLLEEGRRLQEHSQLYGSHSSGETALDLQSDSDAPLEFVGCRPPVCVLDSDCAIESKGELA